MVDLDLINRNKNKIINFGIIILAVVIAFRFYSSANSKVNILMQQQADALKKNQALEEILILEKKESVYKKTFVKKDLAAMMDMVSGVAKTSLVKIDSVKPSSEDTSGGYLSSAFIVTLKAPSYDALGSFISKIENQQDVYLVNEVSITSEEQKTDATVDNNELGVRLKINTIAYL